MEEIVITYEVNNIIKKQKYNIRDLTSLRTATKLLAEKYKAPITILDFRVKFNGTTVYKLLTAKTYSDGYHEFHINPPSMFNELVDKYIKLQPNQ